MVTQADVLGYAPASVFDAVTPALGSIGFDTTNKLIRAGDGTTVGGIKIGAAAASAGGGSVASIAELQTTPSTAKGVNLAVPGIGGFFAWAPANMSAMVAIDTQRGIYVPPASDTSGASGCWIRQFSGYVNLAWFGAVAGQDCTVACRVGIAVANALKTMATVTPSDQLYFVGETLKPAIGFAGIHPRLVMFGATSAAAFSDGKAIMECDAIGAFFADFGIIGLANRTASRSADQSTSGFNGDGLRFTSNANRVVVRNVRVEKCRRGFDMQNENGHINVFGGFASNCWWNVWIGKNTGDYLFTGVDLDGALYASIGLDNNFVSSTKPGGISAAVFIQCHLGFCPYGIRQEPGGNASVGFGDITLIHCRFEKIGNRAISVTGTNTSGVRIVAPGHGWAVDGDNYHIAGDGNHPVRDYAVVYQNIAGGASGATMRVEGAGWMVGSSGFHTRINGPIQHFFTDTNGTAGYSFGDSGGERIMDGSQPGGFTTRVQVPGSTALTTASKTLATITRPSRHATANNGTITMPFEYSASNAASVKVRVNGQLAQILQLPQGQGSAAINITGTFDQMIAITVDEGSGVTIFNNGVAGYLTARFDYGAASV